MFKFPVNDGVWQFASANHSFCDSNNDLTHTRVEVSMYCFLWAGPQQESACNANLG